MNEGKQLPLIPLRLFFKRVACNLAIGLGIIAFSLALGMSGYAYFEKMGVVDAYQNAAMILSGMGPVDTIKTTEGKIFAGTYALYSGVIFLVVIAIIVAPIFHRFFHRFLVSDKH